MRVRPSIAVTRSGVPWQGRTRMKQLEWRMRDTLALLWGALVLAGMIVLSRFGL